MSKNHFLLLSIVGLALILRLGFLFVFQPPMSWSDSPLYDAPAWNLVQGYGYVYEAGDKLFGLREPGYALFFLVPIYFIFGHSILAAQITQIFLSIAIILLIFLLGKKYLSEKIALVATFLYSVFAYSVVYTTEILTDTPFTFLLLLAISILLLGIEKKSWFLGFGGGLVLGLATLTRFISLFFPVVIIFIFYFYFKHKNLNNIWRHALTYSGLVALGVLLVVLPWIFKVSLEYKTLVLGRLGGGQIYWSGSYIPSGGDWVEDGDLVKKAIVGEETDPVKLDKRFTNIALQNIMDNPLGVAALWIKKPFKIFLGIENVFSGLLGVDIDEPSQCLTKTNLTICLLVVGSHGFYVLSILAAILGLFVLFKRDYKAIAVVLLAVFLYFIIFYLPFNPVLRYRVPLLPYLSLLAAVGFVYCYQLRSRLFSSLKRLLFLNKN